MIQVCKLKIVKVFLLTLDKSVKMIIIEKAVWGILINKYCGIV